MEMNEITKEQLLAIMPGASERVDKYLPFMNEYAGKYHINTQHRWAHYLSQIAHESGQMRYTHELGKDSYFLRYEKGELGKRLGNIHKGDGARYKGRGFIQITGRYNYGQFQKHCEKPVVENPELLESPELCVMSSMWYWDSHGLNELADDDKLVAITRKINGGVNGLKERNSFLRRAKKTFGIES